VGPDQQQNVMMDGLGIHVCVTGATGYLAGHIVKQLLERQYTVHATCRDPNNMKAVQHLLTLPNAAQLLKLYQADLLCPGSFGEAITGCKYVIHTASPYMVDCSRVKVRGSPAKHMMCQSVQTVFWLAPVQKTETRTTLAQNAMQFGCQLNIIW